MWEISETVCVMKHWVIRRWIKIFYIKRVRRAQFTTFRNYLRKYLCLRVFHTLQVDTVKEISFRLNYKTYLKSPYRIYMNQDCAIRCMSEITSVEGSETAICICCPDPGVCVYLLSSFAR